MSSFAFEMIVSFAEKKSKLCLKIPNFVTMAIRTCMTLMLELEDSEVASWAARFSDTDADGEDATMYDIGEENVDRFAQAFGIFDLVQVMTGGGPAGATETVSVYIYATIRRYLDFGYGAALVVVTFLLLIVAVCIAAFFLSKLRVNIIGDQ
jgi:hypothetical protein